MVLRWVDICVEGAFDGIKIPITRVSGRGGRTLAAHTYPDVPGQEVEDQGRVAAVYNVEATYGPDLADVWGDNIYPEGLRLLLKRFEGGGSATFVHPIWGETKCAVNDWNFDDAASAPDKTVIAFTLIEDSLEPFSLKDSTALSKVKDAEVRAENVDAEMRARFSLDLDINPFADLIASLRLLLFQWNSLQYIIESKFAKIRADFRVLVDLYGLGDADHFDLLEEVIIMQADMIDSVAAFEVDFPMFITEAVPGDTSLFELAIKYYGESGRDRWEDLLSLNSSRVFNPSHVPAGTSITRQAT